MKSVRARVSVIVPTRNRGADVVLLLESLLRQTLLPDEVLVIDESTDPAHPAMIRAWAGQHPGLAVRVVAATVGSLARSRNIGIRESTGAYVMFLDDDIITAPGYLAEMVAALEAPGEHYAGGSGLPTADPGFSPRYPKAQRFKRFFRLGHFADGRFLVNGMGTLPCERERVVATEFVPGGVNIFRRELFREYQFDERLSGYSNFDDIDFSYRASRHQRFFFNPRALVYHKDHQDKRCSRAARFQHCRMWTRNYLYFFAKNIPPTAASCCAAGWAIVGIVLLSCRHRLLSEVKGYLYGIFETLRDGPRPV